MTNENGLEDENLNAAQVDAQRARYLLDRALGLSERGDLAGAIVVCRQALALAPHQPQGWSMLGLLYERNGEIDGAIEAYGKVLELSPSSTLERESLQRLRQRRGPAPRPAPSFHFGSDAVPPVPAQAANPIHAPASFLIRWDTFYFRSLPFALAVVGCLVILIAAQRSAFHRQQVNPSNNPPTQTQQATTAASPATAPAPAASGSSASGVSTPPKAADLPPTALAPHVSHTMTDTQTDQPAAHDSTTDPVSPVPRPVPAPPKRTSKPAPKPKPKPKTKPATKPRTRPKAHSSTPSEMPVLPRPKITLPQRSAPVESPENDSNRPGVNPAPSGGGQSSSGPVDVGDSDDSKYIPINPPSFPNASRN